MKRKKIHFFHCKYIITCKVIILYVFNNWLFYCLQYTVLRSSKQKQLRYEIHFKFYRCKTSTSKGLPEEVHVKTLVMMGLVSNSDCTESESNSKQ